MPKNVIFALLWYQKMKKVADFCGFAAKNGRWGGIFYIFLMGWADFVKKKPEDIADYTCEVIVKKSVEQNRFYLHEVEIEKNLADVFKTSLNTGTPASSRLSIAKKWEQVKTTSQIKSTQNRFNLVLYGEKTGK